MEEACDFILTTLRDAPETAFATIACANAARDNPFNLVEVLNFLPQKQYDTLANHVTAAVNPAILHFQQTHPAVSRPFEQALNVASQILFTVIRASSAISVDSLRHLLYLLHDVLLVLPAIPAQRTIVNACEWFWHANHPDRSRIIPQTLLYLLVQSFGDETYLVDGGEDSAFSGGKEKDVKRVFEIRKAFQELELNPQDPGSSTMHKLLLRAVSSPIYLKCNYGRKFIGHLLSLEDIRGDVFDTMLNQLTFVPKRIARLYGPIFIHSWSTTRSDWLVSRLTGLAQKAILAAREPFASNLRQVLASIHFNKRMNGIDLLLHQMYAPTLFPNLMVANDHVRKNAVSILAEAFPIHNPGDMVEDIENIIQSQCTKMLEMLVDPAPIVRRAAAEGVCRVLCLFWEIVPSLSARKMIDVITSKLVFDMSSSAVRFGALDSLAFLMDNHQAHPLLAIALPKLRPLWNDSVEKVRLALVSLLVKVKEKRLKHLRYFDIVPVSDLLIRLPNEPSAVALKILRLLVSSHFPVMNPEKSKTQEEINHIQMKACVSTIQKSEAAARFFYRNLYMYIEPIPLCDFALRLWLTIESPEDGETKERVKGGKTRKRKAMKRSPLEDVNMKDNYVAPKDTEEVKTGKDTLSKEVMFATVADVLISLGPSLEKDKNGELREYMEDRFSGNALADFLKENKNSPQTRAACWRIASCITATRLKPLIVLWREQMDSVVDWEHEDEESIENYNNLLSAMTLCAVRWKTVPTLLAVVSKWAECASASRPSAKVGLKNSRRRRMPHSSARSRGRNAGRVSSSQDDHNDQALQARMGSLFALQTLGNILMDEDNELRGELERVMTTSKSKDKENAVESPPGRLISYIRSGSVGALDHLFEGMENDCAKEDVPEYGLALKTLSIALKASLTFAVVREEQERVLPDLREILEWLCGDDIWRHLCRVNRFFASTLLSVCLAPIADAAALGRFNKQDLHLLQRLSERMSTELTGVDTTSIERAAAEMLRLAIQLDERGSFFEVGEVPVVMPYNAAELQKFAVSVTGNVFDLLGTCKISRSLCSGPAFRMSDVHELLLRSLQYMGDNERRERFLPVMGTRLAASFSGEDEVKSNFIAQIVCHGIRKLVTGSASGNCEVAKSLLSFLHDSILGGLESDTAGKKAVFTMTCGIVKAIDTFCEEEQKPVSRRAVEWLGALEEDVVKEFADHGLGEEVSEGLEGLRETIGLLRNAADKEATEAAEATEATETT